MRGETIDYLVTDEAAFVKESVFSEILLPMLNVRGKKCLVMHNGTARKELVIHEEQSRKGRGVENIDPKTNGRPHAEVCDSGKGDSTSYKHSSPSRIHSIREEEGTEDDLEPLQETRKHSTRQLTLGEGPRNTSTKRAVLFQGGRGSIPCWYLTGGGPRNKDGSQQLTRSCAFWSLRSGDGCGLPYCACQVSPVDSETESSTEETCSSTESEGSDEGYGIETLATDDTRPFEGA